MNWLLPPEQLTAHTGSCSHHTADGTASSSLLADRAARFPLSATTERYKLNTKRECKPQLCIMLSESGYREITGGHDADNCRQCS